MHVGSVSPCKEILRNSHQTGLTHTMKSLRRLPVAEWRVFFPSLQQECTQQILPCFGRGVGLDDPQSSLPTPTILWFCEIRTSRGSSTAVTTADVEGIETAWQELVLKQRNNKWQPRESQAYQAAYENSVRCTASSAATAALRAVFRLDRWWAAHLSLRIWRSQPDLHSS